MQKISITTIERLRLYSIPEILYKNKISLCSPRFMFVLTDLDNIFLCRQRSRHFTAAVV